nr:MAG TPA: hypothetical protein [Caudoviricetes sp.]
MYTTITIVLAMTSVIVGCLIAARAYKAQDEYEMGKLF